MRTLQQVTANTTMVLPAQATGRAWRCRLAAMLIGLFPLAGHTADPAAVSGDSTEAAILEELKAIRQLLEKIEKQGSNSVKQAPSRPTTATVTISGKPFMGSETAPVTVVEFTDYQCPYCLRFIKTAFPHLKRDYIDTGKVRWVALNLPLAFHKDAKKAAQAAHCAGEQDKFWDMRQVLFRNPNKLAAAQLPEHAASLGLDIDAFKACLASNRYLDEIEQDASDARAMGLTGTPSFVIGRSAGDSISGQVVIGAQPLTVFTAAINKLLGAEAGVKR